MVLAPAIGIEPARGSDLKLLENLLELYVHDMSAYFPNVELGPDGRFGYAKLPLYWSEPDRYPFLIRMESRVVGFALVTRGSPVSDDPATYDIAEFFVLRAYRRLGVGRRAAFALWQTLRGPWTVRVSVGNAGAARFWSDAVGRFTENGAVESARPGSPHGWRVWSFRS